MINLSLILFQKIPEVVSICKKCISPKPPRTHHCSVCKTCVLKMDHHCRILERSPLLSYWGLYPTRTWGYCQFSAMNKVHVVGEWWYVPLKIYRPVSGELLAENILNISFQASWASLTWKFPEELSHCISFEDQVPVHDIVPDHQMSCSDLKRMMILIGHRENSTVTQTTPEPTLLTWEGWPREKKSPPP